MNMKNCEKCNKSLNVDTEEHVACAHCLDAIYCSSKCQAMDWEEHDCANVLNVSNIASASVFTPYHYEDTMSLEMQNMLSASDPVRQTYSMEEVTPNMTIRTRHQEALIDKDVDTVQSESLKRGLAFADGAGNYSIEINQTTGIGGAMPRDLIFADNKLNPRANTLGGGKIQAETNQWAKPAKESSFGKKQTFVDTRDTLIFWPGSDRVYAENIDLPLAGKLDVKLSMNDGAIVKHIQGHYDFLHETTEPSNLVRKNMMNQLEPRIAGVIDSSKDIRCIQHTDKQGNRAVLTALIEDDSARLVDVEFLAPSATLKVDNQSEYKYSERKIECNPENVGQLVGLAMGLELHTKSGRAKNPRLNELSKTISQYAQEKLANPEKVELNSYMAGAVNEAVETMHEEFIAARRRFGTNPFKSASKYARRLRSSKQVVRAAKRVKNDAKLSYVEKEDKLQTMYDTQLELARKLQEQGKIAQDYLDRADQIFSIAMEDLPERRRGRKKLPAAPAIVLNGKETEVRMLKEKDAELQNERMRQKDQDREYRRDQSYRRRGEKKEYRRQLKDNRRKYLDDYSNMSDSDSSDDDYGFDQSY